MEEKSVKSLDILINISEKVTVYNAQQCLKDFDENWKTITAETPERHALRFLQYR